MKLIIQNKELKKALKRLGTVVPKKAVLSALEYIRITAKGNTMVLSCTDLDLTIHYELLLIENATKEDTALVNFNWLKGICDLHGEEIVQLETLKTKTHIETSAGKFTQEVGVKLSEYPNLPEIPSTDPIPKLETIIPTLQRSAMILVAEDVRQWPCYSLVELQNRLISITSTDANSLFNCVLDYDYSGSDKNILISQRMIKALSGLTDSSFRFNENLYSFTSGEVTVIAKIPDVKFPNYKGVIPARENYMHVLLNRVELIEVLQKVAFTNSETVDLQVKENEVLFHSEHDNGAKSEIRLNTKAPFTGTLDFERIKLNPSKLITLLEQVEFENVHIGLFAPTKAIVITEPDNTNHTSLLMPLVA